MRHLFIILLLNALLLAVSPDIIQCSTQSECPASAGMDIETQYVTAGS